MCTSTRVGAIIGAAALSITLAACGASDSGSSPSMSGMNHSSASSSATSSASASVDTQHNAADVSFTQDMIVHHQSAIDMAKVATTQASSQQVKDLASRIEAAQGPEITEMNSWLQAWGEPISANSTMSSSSSMGDMSGMSSGSMSSGSMSSGSMSSGSADTGSSMMG
ncbi:DUF305 domain-containing protein, partial [Enterococcus hirae]|uniref:DUF305 domain-containing protein n=1 Tax=Enterococcus hirae TaxID=1354 RepID=UPI00136CF04F